MNYTESKKQYLRAISFESLIKSNNLKSEEVYFGLDNPLRTGLIYHLGVVKELITGARARDPGINGLQLIDICEDEFNKISKLIEESFNVERCAIGFQNIINACCYPTYLNKDTAGLTENAAKMRIKLDDIVETKNGFRYKNKKGIYYAACIGLQFFYNDDFTVPEIACILVHELGHAMQHVVHSVNANFAISYWQNVMRAVEFGYVINSKTQNLIKLIEKYHIAKNYNKVAEAGKEILDSTKPEDLIDFSKLDSHELTAIASEQIPIDGDDDFTVKKKSRNIILRTLIGLLKAPLSIICAIFIVPMTLCMKFQLNSKKAGIWKNDEMTADAFEVFYGFGTESGEVTRKLSKMRRIPGDQGLINYVPLLNLWKVCSDMKQEHLSMIFGYPSDKQRIVNAYINCEFELKNNKDLSNEAKKELEEQIKMLQNSYNSYIKNQDTKGGFLYKLASAIGRNTLERAAKKDPSLREAVLEPLMKKRDSGAFK
jgi:hypothetical protein